MLTGVYEHALTIILQFQAWLWLMEEGPMPKKQEAHVHMPYTMHSFLAPLCLQDPAHPIHPLPVCVNAGLCYGPQDLSLAEAHTPAEVSGNRSCVFERTHWNPCESCLLPLKARWFGDHWLEALLPDNISHLEEAHEQSFRVVPASSFLLMLGLPTLRRLPLSWLTHALVLSP